VSKLVLFNKPFQVLSQFSPSTDKTTLADFIPIKQVYPAGRLDYDSEGLLLLTDDGKLQAKISNPRFHQSKIYLAQVEGFPDQNAVGQLARGVILKDGRTRPAKVERVDEPEWLWRRDPPIRERKQIPVSWIKLEISEGRNRQVRRMTAAVGYPTLRLIRTRVADWALKDLLPGQFSEIQV
jgi:23S rRNA pseudouridine2457 synthase